MSGPYSAKKRAPAWPAGGERVFAVLEQADLLAGTDTQAMVEPAHFFTANAGL